MILYVWSKERGHSASIPRWSYTRPHTKMRGGTQRYSTDSQETVEKYCREFGVSVPDWGEYIEFEWEPKSD